MSIKERKHNRMTAGLGPLMAVIILILLFPENSPALDNSVLRGKVVDIESGRPVANAIVVISARDYQLKADENGGFEMRDIPGGEFELKAYRIGYTENTVRISAERKLDKPVIIYLFPQALESEPVIVRGYHNGSRLEQLSEQSAVLSGRELQKELGLSLAATLKNETGLAMRSMGPAPARPVIRGLGGDRILISEDGTKTVDLSATSPDHAVTVEPFTLERLEVIRGPRILEKTSTTIGGVVNVVRHEIPSNLKSRSTGMIGAYGETANKGGLGSALLEIPINPLALRIEAGRRAASDLNTPEGILENSNADNLDLSGGTSYIFSRGYLGGSIRYFDLDYGIPGGFVGGHPNGVDIEMRKYQHNLKSRLNFEGDFINTIEIGLSRVHYRHKELESNGSIGSEFKIVDYLGSLRLNRGSLGFLKNGVWGMSVESRDYDIGGFVFNPPSRSLNLAFYDVESFHAGKFSFEASARFEYASIEPEYDDPDAHIGYIRQRDFNIWSLSFSAVYDMTDILAIGAGLSRSSRAPTIEELYSEGPHLAAYSYEVGNPDLKDEYGFGGEFFTCLNHEKVYLMNSLFYYNLSRYIIPHNTGQINYATFLPIYASENVPAVLYGAESSLDLEISPRFTLSNSVSYTRGSFRNSGKPLPQMPPLKGQLEIRYKPASFSLGCGAHWAAPQKRVDEFEEPTAGYIVYNCFIQYQYAGAYMIHSLTINLDNIFDSEYRNHLSRIKSILPEAGRNLRFTYKLFFDM